MFEKIERNVCLCNMGQQERELLLARDRIGKKTALLCNRE